MKSIFRRTHRSCSPRFPGLLSTAATVVACVAAPCFNGLRPASGVASAAEARTGRTTGSENAELAGAERLSDLFRLAAQQVLPAVVEIKAAQQAAPWNAHAGRRPFGGMLFEGLVEEDVPEMGAEDSEPSLGCGVVVDSSGIVVTNSHVVEDTEEMLVEMPDGRQFKVTDVRRDNKADLAVLRVDCREALPTARLGDSEALRIGDWVLRPIIRATWAAIAEFALQCTYTPPFGPPSRRPIRCNPFWNNDLIQERHSWVRTGWVKDSCEFGLRTP